ncbi:MAG: prolyl oligopeptidase family serine peptidase [Planctomycetaceae bacterium]|nr:prolyl oligopeptidase family serine peptidase [Planctomycetaceae bacterium]
MRMWIVLLLALTNAALAAAAEPTRREWTIDGVKREADVFAPSKPSSDPPPLVFGFHGHGGNIRNAARSFQLHQQWPEAVVVYMQGLNTPGRLTDPEGKKPGWQSAAGDQGDRDLKFFDAVLTSIKEKHKIDERRVYSTGHSNGGGFTYLLWATRGDVFAAVAPSAAVAARSAKDLKPKPVMHIAGENDGLVKFAWQQVAMTRLRTLNECGEGTSWDTNKNCTLYPSKNGNPVVTMIHPGTHKYPEEAPALIVKFFKLHQRATQAAAKP